MTCGSGECAEEVPACVDGRLVQSCDEVDLGEHGEQSCGTGACEVTLPVCRNGAPVDCVPGEPAHFREICGTGIDEDCNGMVDCQDPACFDPRLLLDRCIGTSRVAVDPAGGYLLVAHDQPKIGEARDLLHLGLDERGDPRGTPVVVYESHIMTGAAYSFDIVALEDSYLLFAAAGTMSAKWLELLEVSYGGEVIRSGEIELPPDSPEGVSPYPYRLEVAKVADGGPFLLTFDDSLFYWGLVDREGRLLSPWQAEDFVRTRKPIPLASESHAVLVWPRGVSQDLYDLVYQRIDLEEPALLGEPMTAGEALLGALPFGAVLTNQGEVVFAAQEHDEQTGLVDLVVSRFDRSDQLVGDLVAGTGAGFDRLSMSKAPGGYWLVFDYSDETGWPHQFQYLHVGENLDAISEMQRIGGRGGRDRDHILRVLGGQGAPIVFFQRSCEDREHRRVYIRDMSVCPDGLETEQ